MKNDYQKLEYAISLSSLKLNPIVRFLGFKLLKEIKWEDSKFLNIYSLSQ